MVLVIITIVKSCKSMYNYLLFINFASFGIGYGSHNDVFKTLARA